MSSLRKFLLIALLIFIVTIVMILGIRFQSSILRRVNAIIASPTPIASPAASPKLIQVGEKQKVKYPQDFTIVMVGDSMTELLGNSDELRADLKNYYPDKTIEILNYGFGSTNILSVQTRLTQTVFYHRDFRPVDDIDYQLILVESFGNNPLSQFPLDEGLKKQNETLDQIVQTIRNDNPNAVIAFVATIAPSKKRYAQGQVDLSPDKRAEWATERITYMKNHMDYARSHNIPVIDVFTPSLGPDGDGNLNYISDKDYIHPSPSGVIFISKILGDEIYKQKLLQSN